MIGNRDMTTLMRLLYGLSMVFVGGVKTWLHMGNVPVLSLPTCTGKTITISASQGSWLEQVHCWGCYLFAAGLVVLAIAGVNAYKERRSVTAIMD